MRAIEMKMQKMRIVGLVLVIAAAVFLLARKEIPDAPHTGTNHHVALKPSSIKMGQGATAVVEIDHGLQAVDFMKEDRYSAAVMRAQEKGALGAVTFSVVDDRGQSVPGATVKASF